MPRLGRPAWTVLLWLTLGLLAALPSLGQPDLGAEPQFFLESIAVENTQHVSPDIIVSESLLKAGKTYTEAQLRDAVHRVVRLPFVLDADFSLRKGSLRDRYELVITVHEARTWFFGFDLGRYQLRSNLRPASEVVTTFSTLLAGKRFFLGRHGEFFAALGVGGSSLDNVDDTAALSLGYNQYNLWDKGVLLSLGYGLQGFSSTGEQHQVSASLGIPLKTNQSLNLSSRYGWFDQRRSSEPAFAFDYRRFDASLAWIYNSLDDPTLPTAGWLVETGIHGSTSSARSEGFVLFPDDLPETVSVRYGADSVGLGLSAKRYWPLSPRQSLSARVNAGFSRSRFLDTFDFSPPARSERREDAWSGIVEVGHHFFLLRQRTERAWRELRWETVAQAAESDRVNRPESFFSRGASSWSVGTGLTYRNGWGVYRLRFTFSDSRTELFL